ncbi:MAG: hypothetical protein FJ096_12400 [Deltaproteobacteria bacterium]|nr:hypothetical protein [Deltaproteobacteria bacterium]
MLPATMLRLHGHRYPWFLAVVTSVASPLACTSLLGTFEATGSSGAGQGGSGQGGAATAADASSGTSVGCEGCAADAVCSDGVCACADGFDGDGMTCTDVDECETPGFCGTDATCLNTRGGFECTCNDGFTSTGSGCAPIWEELRFLVGIEFGPFGSFVAGGKSRVFIADAAAAKSVFFTYSVPDNVLGLNLPWPAPDNSFCNCGYRSAVAAFDEMLFAFGNDGQRYEPEKWYPLPTYVEPFRRGEASAATFEKSIFILGGRDSKSSSDQASLLEFNVGTMAFLPETVHPPYLHGTVSGAGFAEFDGKLYAAGGYIDNGKALDRAAVFDPQTNAWSSLESAPFGGAQVDLVAVKSGLFYTNGVKVARFDHNTQSWAPTTFKLPSSLTRARLAAAADTVLAIGNAPGGMRIYRLTNVPE